MVKQDTAFYYFAKVYVHACVCVCLHVCVGPSGFVSAITPTFRDGFQNYLIQLLSLRRRHAILNVFLDRLNV